MTSLHPPRKLISTLISSISTSTNSTQQPQISNPLKDAPPQIQQALLTLHVLFPNELLPALDLLDRNLITHFSIRDEAQQPSNPQLVPDLQPVGADTGEGRRPRADTTERPHPESKLNPLPGEQPHHGSLGAGPSAAPREAQERNRSEGSHDPRQASSNRHPNLANQGQQSPPYHAGQGSPLLREERRSHYPGLTNQESALISTAHAVQAVYRCRSARADVARGDLGGVRSGRGRGLSGVSGLQGGSYEVRLNAWNCSCPAFAFAAFPANDFSDNDDDDHEVIRRWTYDRSNPDEWSFGGLTLGGETRVCKHLLACALVEHCSIFRGLVEYQEVSMEEFAGWAAGWGD